MRIFERLGDWFHEKLLGLFVSTFSGGAAIDKNEIKEDLCRGRTKFVGRVDWWAETGSEGMHWILQEDIKVGYDGMHLIEEGDWLEIYDDGGVVIFDDMIAPNRETGNAEHPFSRGFYQQCALGFWVCWIQNGWQPDDWAAFFIRDEGKRLRAVLYKKGGKDNGENTDCS